MKNTLRKLRIEAGLTQSELAEEVGYSTQSIVSAWESGERTPPSKNLPKLAEVLGCTIDDLFREEEDK